MHRHIWFSLKEGHGRASSRGTVLEMDDRTAVTGDDRRPSGDAAAGLSLQLDLADTGAYVLQSGCFVVDR